MPVKFTNCIKAGGRVRTIKPKGAGSPTYLKICYPKGGGGPVRGEVKHRKPKGK